MNRNNIALVLLSFFLFITNKVFSQEYVPLPDSNAVWKVNLVSSIPPPIWGYNFHYQYEIKGDTTIGSFTYKKIYQTWFDIFCTKIITSGPTYIGGIRQEIDERKVFYLPNGNYLDSLLYDFTLNVGDTLPLGFNNGSNNPTYVASIDSILVQGQYRKRINLLGDIVYCSLIEGIGSTRGLIEDIGFFEYGGYLNCFILNDNIINLAGVSCYLDTDTCLSIGYDDIDKTSESILFYNNPAACYFLFKLPDNVSSIRFYDVAGRKVKEIGEINEQELTIQKHYFERGIYFYQVILDNKITHRGKFIH